MRKILLFYYKTSTNLKESAMNWSDSRKWSKLGHISPPPFLIVKYIIVFEGKQDESSIVNHDSWRETSPGSKNNLKPIVLPWQSPHTESQEVLIQTVTTTGKAFDQSTHPLSLGRFQLHIPPHRYFCASSKVNTAYVHRCLQPSRYVHPSGSDSTPTHNFNGTVNWRFPLVSKIKKKVRKIKTHCPNFIPVSSGVRSTFVPDVTSPQWWEVR